MKEEKTRNESENATAKKEKLSLKTVSDALIGVGIDEMGKEKGFGVSVTENEVHVFNDKGELCLIDRFDKRKDTPEEYAERIVVLIHSQLSL